MFSIQPLDFSPVDPWTGSGVSPDGFNVMMVEMLEEEQEKADNEKKKDHRTVDEIDDDDMAGLTW
jgi:hypothetical protein